MRAPSSPVLRTRPCPTFGRPVHHRGSPHRLRPGTSPHALRIPPHDGHPALRRNCRLVASDPPWLVSGFRFRARLGFVIPSTFSGPRGITPAFGYGAPHSSARGTSTLLSNALLSAHYSAVRLPATVHVGLIAHRLLPPVRSVSTTDSDWASRFSRVEFLCVRRVFDSAGPRGTRVIAPRVIAFRTRERRPLPDLRISELNTSPTYTPIQRFECALTTALAWLGARLVRYSLPV